jgi:hypothetical protein
VGTLLQGPADLLIICMHTLLLLVRRWCRATAAASHCEQS